MRDPDLVMQAEQAAMALEHAWRLWRRKHGLAAESILPVSSYVGYSPAEPWGQPRVVFGMAADDAAQLTLLLEGHDCVGPVHAGLAALPGGQADAAAPGDAGAPVAVPQQNPPGFAARPRPGRLRPPRRPDPLDPAQVIEFADPHASRRLSRRDESAEPDQSGRTGYGPGEVADDQDGPVFRQAAAAAAEAAAARHAAEQSAARHAAEQSAARHAAEQSAARHAAGVAARNGVVAAAVGDRANEVAPDDLVAASTGPRGGLPADGFGEMPSIDQDQPRGRAPAAGQDRGTAGSLPFGRFPLPGEPAVPAPRSADGSGEPGMDELATADRRSAAEPPGPLTLAAAAARAAAEARIKAARLDHRAASRLEDPYGSDWPSRGRSMTGPREAGSDAQPGGPPTGSETVVLPPVPGRPEVASGAITAQAAPLPVYPSPALFAGIQRPGSGAGANQVSPVGHAGPANPTADDDPEPDDGVVAFRPKPALAAYLDQGPEAGQFFDETGETSSSGLDRRSRLAQFGIPRLPRGRRPGTAPGTA